MSEPVIRARSSLSLVWLIPLVTALIGGWLVVRTLSERGPLVTITFRTADGIEVQKTRIKYKSLDIGLVEGVRFSPDFAKVEVRARLSTEAAHFLRRDSRFWVVRPTLSVRGISGLGTLLSGSYIEIEPGQGEPQAHFVGLESPPVITADQAGTRITLIARRLGSIDRGSPVHYHGIVVGEVLGHEMADDFRNVLVHAFIKAPFNHLVRSNTRFWNTSGVDLSVSPDGLRIKTESLQALLFGGIAFDTPNLQSGADENVDGLVFTLHDDLKAIEEQSYMSKLRYVLFFEDSVRGLTVGAPVEFKGIKIGSVIGVQLEYNERQGAFQIPVLIEIEPGRIAERGESMRKAPRQAFEALVKRGLRARLQTGSLLTGQLYIELDLHPKSPLRRSGLARAEPELPTLRGDFGQMTASLRGILDKLDQVDFVAIGGDLQGTLKAANAAASAPAVQAALTDLAASLASVRAILRKLEDRTTPLADRLEQALAAARLTLDKTTQTMTLVDGLIAPDSPLHDSALRLTQDLSATARSVRSLIELLERNPQALLFGNRPDPENRP